MAGFCGLMEIETNAGVTVSVVEELNAPELAVIVAVPWVKVDANPDELIVATAVVDEYQVAVLVKSTVLPST